MLKCAYLLHSIHHIRLIYLYLTKIGLNRYIDKKFSKKDSKNF